MALLNIKFYPKPRGSSSKTNCTTIKPPTISSINVTRKDLLWGALYGNRENRLSSNIDLRFQRDLSMIDYYFDYSGKDLLINNDLFCLEKTCKAFDASRIGMILCNIVAKKLFHVKHLYHFLKFSGASIKKSLPTNSSPDYIASNTTGFYLFEAKGTLTGSASQFDDKAVSQLNTVASVNGKTPFKIIISFHVNGNRAEVDVIDPTGVDGLNINFAENSPIFGFNHQNIFKKTIEIDGRQFKCVECLDYIVGYDENCSLDQQICDCDLKCNYRNSVCYIYSDGTLIVDKKHKIFEKIDLGQ